jgi:hypothetical protein
MFNIPIDTKVANECGIVLQLWNYPLEIYTPEHNAKILSFVAKHQLMYPREFLQEPLVLKPDQNVNIVRNEAQSQQCNDISSSSKFGLRPAIIQSNSKQSNTSASNLGKRHHEQIEEKSTDHFASARKRDKKLSELQKLRVLLKSHDFTDKYMNNYIRKYKKPHPNSTDIEALEDLLKSLNWQKHPNKYCSDKVKMEDGRTGVSCNSHEDCQQKCIDRKDVCGGYQFNTYVKGLLEFGGKLCTNWFGPKNSDFWTQSKSTRWDVFENPLADKQQQIEQ